MNTIDYYNQNASSFVENTLSVDFTSNQDRFINALHGPDVLDFGCGSGRDTKYFLEVGLSVTATDGSLELCKIASEYTGIQVRHQLFQQLDDQNMYDGIWACASILHLPKNELKTVLIKMVEALKKDGVIYASFKYGDFEGERNGRYFTDFTLESFTEYISDINGISLVDSWISGDVRPGRENEKWLNVLLQNGGRNV